MTHDEARERLEALALDVLSPVERQDILEYLESDPALRMEFEALEATAAELTYLVRPMPIEGAERDRIRSRLLGRAHGDTGRPPVLRQTPTHGQILMPYTTHPNAGAVHIPSGWMTSTSSWIAMAASIVAIAFAASWYQVSKERDKYALAYSAISGDRVSGAPAVDSLKNVLADRDALIANLTGSQVSVVTLAANNSAGITARMFWDQSVNKWTFIAHNLPTPRSGRIFQLWLVTANQKISAGTFAPQANGDAVVRATYSLPREALAAVAVTDEPVEGSAQPTTVPFIVGSRGTR